MNDFRRCHLALLLVPIFLCASFLSGCSTPRAGGKAATRDQGFIEYWPPAENSSRLRLAVKDLIDMKGVVTTAGSAYLARNSPPARRDAKCLQIARERNVQFVGKTNVTEFAVSVSGINDYFGTPRNRVSRRARLIPGGSSSGSAVAVANGMADVAFGTDTAGSIRVPAACCGVVGLKTTFGLVPLDGVYPISPEYLDTVGPMAKDVKHTVLGMDLLQRGFAAKYRAEVASHPTGRSLRVGRLYLQGTNAQVDRAVDEALAARKFEVVVLDRAFREAWEQAEKDAETIAAASAWINAEKFRKERGISARTKAVLLVGETEYSLHYKAAVARQAQWKRMLRRVFQQVDLIALPTLQGFPPRVPFLGGSPAFELLVFGMQNTAAVNFAGNPAIAVPVPAESKVSPVTSLQLIGPQFSEARLLNAARIIEGESQETAAR